MEDVQPPSNLRADLGKGIGMTFLSVGLKYYVGDAYAALALIVGAVLVLYGHFPHWFTLAFWTTDRIAIAWLPVGIVSLSGVIYAASLYVFPLSVSIRAPALPTSSDLTGPYQKLPPTQHGSPPNPTRVLNLLYKDSALWTPERKTKVQGEIEEYYRYLTSFGFDLPKTVPPIEIVQGHALARSFGDPEPLLQFFTLGTEEINRGGAARYYYSSYIFETLFGEGKLPIDPEEGMLRERLAITYSSYYARQFEARNPDDSHDEYLKSLWDIRIKCNPAFTNRLLLFAVKLFDQTQHYRHSGNFQEDFKKYFFDTLFRGERVVDNRLEHSDIIHEVLKAHGVWPY